MKRLFTLVLMCSLCVIFTVTALAASTKKIFCIQSYEKGIGCGARLEAGMIRTLKELGYEEGKNIKFFHFYMETRHKYIKPEEVKMRGRLALKEIFKVDLDIVLIFDDNACEHVMLPLAKSKYPIVFSGVNIRPEYYNGIKDFM